MRFELKNGEHKSVVLLWVCHEFNIDIDDLTSKSKESHLVVARAMVAKLLRDKNETLESIGLVLNRHYSGVINLLRNHNKNCKNLKYFNTYNELTRFNKNTTILERLRYHQNEVNKLMKLL